MRLVDEITRMEGFAKQLVKELGELKKHTQETFDKLNEPPPLFPEWEDDNGQENEK